MFKIKRGSSCLSHQECGDLDCFQQNGIIREKCFNVEFDIDVEECGELKANLFNDVKVGRKVYYSAAASQTSIETNISLLTISGKAVTYLNSWCS